MKSTNIMTLFSEEPRPGTGPSYFLLSAVFHCVVGVVLLLGLRHAPRMNDHTEAERYNVRLLRPPLIEPAMQRAAKGSTQAVAQAAASKFSGGGAPALSIPYPQTQEPPHSQVLLQPDAPPNQVIPQETPIPLAVMWSPENSPSKVIVAPPQQEPTAAQTRPALIKPNREPNLSDINITMTPFPSKTPMLPPGTTSPMVVRRREEINQIPSTSTAQLEPPTPARVLSISPLQAVGPVIIPLANSPGSSSSSDLVISATPGKNSSNGAGNPASKQSGVGTGDGPGVSKGAGTAAGGNGTAAQGTAVARNGVGAPGGAGAGAEGGGNDAGAGAAGHGPGFEPSLVHLSLPKDGQFGIVVVGSSVEDQYPEIVGIWGSRLVYTVYLHVGTGKNWILQYCVPRTQEAAAGGNVAKPEAPWPYDILRPHLAPEDFNSDALMVHGFVNMAGKFEHLAMVFPTEFKQAKFVLDALQRWQFRPAKQNGQVAPVEVLLIIPEETE